MMKSISRSAKKWKILYYINCFSFPFILKLILAGREESCQFYFIILTESCGIYVTWKTLKRINFCQTNRCLTCVCRIYLFPNSLLGIGRGSLGSNLFYSFYPTIKKKMPSNFCTCGLTFVVFLYSPVLVSFVAPGANFGLGVGKKLRTNCDEI